MRTALIALALMAVTPAAMGANVFKDIFRYECQHASADSDGLTCAIQRGAITLTLADDKPSTHYHASKLLRDYHAMPGHPSRFVLITHGGQGKTLNCSFIRTVMRAGAPARDHFSYTCRASAQ